ncbi:MAG: hypothetical protein LBP50_02550 [Tannerella sp.]|nr:hypothetical protein [Tannerella sp.]
MTSLKVGKNDLFNIQYDEFDRLVSIDEYFNGTKSIQVRYAYDLDGRKYAGDLCMSLFEYEEWDYEKQTWRAGRFRRKVRKHAPVDYPDGGVSSRILTHEEYVADASGKWVGDKKYDMAYDSNGKRSIMYHYVWYGNRWTQIQYTVYYPNSYTSSVTPGNNNPVGNTDKGGFDIRITLPADSIAAGSFVVRLPDGFSLDKDNSALTTGFNDFVLGITKQEDNSWLFTVKPKDTRSAALLSGEAGKTLAHVAYTVDGEVKRGTYDITVHSIQFETPGGESIVEPAITVPARLNRWGVASEVIDVSPSQAWSHNGLIHVHSGRPQQVAVYSLSGAKLYEGHVQAGTAALSGLRLPKGLYIIILADGESLKVPVD